MTDRGEDFADLQRDNSTSSDTLRFSPGGKRLALGALHIVTVWDVSDVGPPRRGRASRFKVPYHHSDFAARPHLARYHYLLFYCLIDRA
jgi:hypothetical protein